MARRRRPRKTLETCGHCNATFPAGRLACPHCGSDADTGWSEDAEIDQGWAAIPDSFDEDDYEAVLRDLPGGGPPESRFLTQRQFLNLVVGLVLVVALIYVFVL